MYKLYSDTNILINESSFSVEVMRGYWNFSQLILDFGSEKERDHILHFFVKFQERREINSDNLNSDLHESLDQMVALGLVYKTESFADETKIRRICYLTDSYDYVEPLIKRAISSSSFELCGIDYFKENILLSSKIEDIHHDPIIRSDVTNRLDEYISKMRITHLVVILNKVDNEFCSLLNDVTRMETTYVIRDKDFGYIFDVNKLYTGCYDCFSRSLDARKRAQQTFTSCCSRKQKSVPVKLDSSYYNQNEIAHFDLLIKAMQVYLRNYITSGFNPLFGRLFANSDAPVTPFHFSGNAIPMFG